MRILVADDDVEFARLVERCLAQAGYETVVVAGGEAALEAARSFAPHLIVLDVYMPDLTGHEVCRRLRETCSAPVLMLSGFDDEASVVHGLDVGADGYLVKPFRSAELLARVHALLRRAAGQVSVAGRGYRDQVLVVDPLRQRVEKHGQAVAMSRNEWKLLAYLVERCGVVVSPQELQELLGDPATGRPAEQAQLALYIGYLRKKLEDDPRHPRYLRTQFKKGYLFVGDEGATVENPEATAAS